MGRTLKRVPLDFDWSLNEIWQGYLNPISPLPCEVCEGDGQSPEYKRLLARWYGSDRPAKWAWCDKAHTRRWNKVAWNNNLSKKDVQALLDANRLWDFTRVPLNRVQREIVKRKRANGEIRYTYACFAVSLELQLIFLCCNSPASTVQATSLLVSQSAL